jgi:hypothetical protein
VTGSGLSAHLQHQSRGQGERNRDDQADQKVGLSFSPAVQGCDPAGVKGSGRLVVVSQVVR